MRLPGSGWGDGTEHRKHHFGASYFIGNRADKNDYDGLGALLDETDRIVDDVAGYTIQEFDEHLEGNDLPKRMLNETMEFEKIGPLATTFTERGASLGGRSRLVSG